MTTVVTEPGIIHETPDDHAGTPAVARIPVGDHHTAVVDISDVPLVQKYRWHLLPGHNGKLYAYTRFGIYMHRIIAQTPAGMETDHINGDGLDNRRVNLRHATPSQNKANMRKPSRPNGERHSSSFKGVSWDKSRSKWQAKITVNQACRSLGRYEEEKDAALAYDRAALTAWGNFAQLNFPKEAKV